MKFRRASIVISVIGLCVASVGIASDPAEATTQPQVVTVGSGADSIGWRTPSVRTSQVTITNSGTSQGARTVLTLKTSGAPSRYAFPVTLPSGTRLVPDAQGGYTFVRSTGVATAVLGHVEAPWAVDATGKSLVTKYELEAGSAEGPVLTQTIDTSGARFPVTADPHLTYGVGVYLNMYGAEISAVGAAAVLAGGVADIAVCAGLAWIPLPIAKVASVICTLTGVVSARRIFKTIIRLYQGGVTPRACYQLKIVPSSSKWKHVKAKNCH